MYVQSDQKINRKLWSTGKNFIQIEMFFFHHSLLKHIIEFFVKLMNRSKTETQMVVISKDWKDFIFNKGCRHKTFYFNALLILNISRFSLHPYRKMKMFIMLIVSGAIFETELTNISIPIAYMRKHFPTYSLFSVDIKKGWYFYCKILLFLIKQLDWF